MSGSGCPKCGQEARNQTQKLTTATFITKARKVHKDVYQYNRTVYTLAHENVTITCAKHGDFEQAAYSHLAGRGCPKCNTSKIENVVAAWVTKLCNTQTNKKILDGKEIDIYCPDKKLGIEINGVYWHSSKFLPRSYHYSKALVAKRKGIKLLQFWEDELRTKTAICKSMIKSQLGLSSRYYARQLSIQPLTAQEARIFFDTVHLQGYANATATYGLFNGTQCLAAMSFGKPRFNKDYEWEIVRFANVLNATVVGGASRLFKHFIREHEPKSMISYADLRISQGTLYKQLGFKFSHVSKPNFFWSKPGGLTLSRYKSQKHRLGKLLGEHFDANLSGRENMAKSGWTQVFDAGNLVFIWSA
jgi:very-short-patch-repair endonuclease